jgi:hypothetical protein
MTPHALPPISSSFSFLLSAEEASASLLLPPPYQHTKEPQTPRSSTGQLHPMPGMTPGDAAPLASLLQQGEGLAEGAVESNTMQWAGQPVLLDAAVKIDLRQFTMAVHRWAGTSGGAQHAGHSGALLAVDARTQVCATYLDSAALDYQTLLEPSVVELCYEQAPVAIRDSSSSTAHPAAASQHAAPAAGKQAPLPAGAPHARPRSPQRQRAGAGRLPDMQPDMLLAAALRPTPAVPGTSLSINIPAGPMRVNVGELTVPELQRLLTIASMEFGPRTAAVQRRRGGEPGGTMWHGTAAEGVCAAPPAILIRNATALELVIRQCGTADVVHVPRGAAVPYCWPVAPHAQQHGGARRQMQLGCITPSSTGSGAGTEVQDASTVLWSKAIEVGVSPQARIDSSS